LSSSLGSAFDGILIIQVAFGGVGCDTGSGATLTTVLSITRFHRCRAALAATFEPNSMIAS
jgi:hypothetical protein